MKLVLFDLDGTLLNTGTSGIPSLEKAFKNLYGKEPSYDIKEMIAKSDKFNAEYIYKSTFKKNASAAQVKELKKEYLNLLPQEVATQIKTKKYKTVKGVEAFLKTLASMPNVKLALATGNYEEAAKIKLTPSGLDKYFETGAFGADATDRVTLLQKAVEKASKHFKTKFNTEDVFVIGDTHIDIVSAKANGYHNAVITEAGLGDKDRILRAAAELDVKDFTDIEILLVWLNEKADPKGIEKGVYIMPASAIEHVFFSRTGIDEQRLKMFRIKKYSDLESGKL